MKRKTLLVIFSCVLVFAISAGATYAWLIARDGAVNIFTIGENDIELIEIFEPPEELIPGETFHKEPVVRNTGNFPAFARARVVFSNLEGYNISVLETNGASRFSRCLGTLSHCRLRLRLYLLY